MQFEGHSKDEIVDATLGLKSVRLSKVSADLARFGIKLPLMSKRFAEMKGEFRGKPIDSCTVTFQNDQPPTSVTFEGHFYAPIIPSMGYLGVEKFRVVCKSFSILISGDIYKIESSAQEKRLTPSDWLAYCQLAHVLSSQKGELRIVTARKKLKFACDIGGNKSVVQLFDGSSLQRICTSLIDILRLADVKTPLLLTEDELWDSANQILSMHHFFQPQPGEVPLDIWFDADDGEIEKEMLYVDYLRIRNLTIAYYGIIRVSRNVGQLKGEFREGKLLAIKRLRSNTDYKGFVEVARASTTCTDSWVRPF